MNQVISGMQARSGEVTTVAILNPLVHDIVKALLVLGGAAHRDSVIGYIARQRGLFRPSTALIQDLQTAFSAYCGGAVDPRSRGLLHLPYGPNSHRWALTDQAYGLLRDDLGALKW